MQCCYFFQHKSGDTNIKYKFPGPYQYSSKFGTNNCVNCEIKVMKATGIGLWKRVVEEGCGRGLWERVVEEGCGRGLWERVVEEG